MNLSPVLRCLTVLCFGLSGGVAAEPASEQSDPRRKSESVKPAAKTPSVRASARYRDARTLEKKGDQEGALLAFQEAADAGHGAAQMRLAEIYDRGNPAVKRDYAKALYWYEKARAQGLRVPRPHPYVTGH